MTHLKKSLALLLAFVMIFSSMSVAASAADDESAKGNEAVTFTVKFFRKDANGNWIETTKAAPGEHIKARAYVSTNYYTHTFASSLLFDTDFFKVVSASTDSDGNTTFLEFPQDTQVPHVANSNYIVTDGNLVQLSGSVVANETYRTNANKFFQVPYLISNDIISEDYFNGKELIYSQIVMPETFKNVVKLNDAEGNWYDEYDFVVRNEENAVTKQVDEKGVAVVPKELRGTIETVVTLQIGAQLINVPRARDGIYSESGETDVLGLGWEIAEDKFASTEGVITTTSSVLLDANGGEFEGGATTSEIRGIIKDSVYDEITASEAIPTRTNFKHVGWSKIKTARGADITDEILSAIGYSEMTDEEIAALGWKHTNLLNKNGYLAGVEIGTPLTPEMVAEIGLADKTASQLELLGLNVTSEILAELAIDKANTKYNYDEYTLYALWDNSGVSAYTVETYLMGTDGKYSSEATQKDVFYSIAGDNIPLQATAKEGFTLDVSSEDGTAEKSSESVKVEADGSSVLKAYYARNKYTVTYKYEDITGPQEETREVYYGDKIPAFGYLPADVVDLYLVDADGNKTSVIPETMPAENITILGEAQMTYLFDAGEGATFPSTGERTMTYVYKFGAVPEIPEAPVKDGYVFVDWDVAVPEKVIGSMTFNAMYNPLEGTKESYTVTFHDKNGDVIDSSDGYWYGYEFEAVDIPEGYGDNVWKLADGTVVSFPYTIKEDTEFYPISDDANVYNAYFYEDDTDAEPYATSPTTYGEAIDAPEKNPEKNGYHFLGWSTDPDAAQPEELGVMDSMDGKKFYAVFAPNEVTLTFNTDGGTEIAPITGTFGEPLEEPVTTKPGYTLGGWYDKDGKQVLIPETFPAESAEYTAKWNANTYNVIYKNNGVLVTDELVKAKTGDTVAVLDGSMVKKDGHTFAGWKSSADGIIYKNPADEASAASFTMPGSDVTLDAQWTPNKHVVVLDANGGAFADNSEIYANDDVAFGTVLADAGVPADPAWPTDEKTFKGWADADDTTEKIVYAPGELQQAAMSDESLNLVAIWEDVVVPTYTATFITTEGYLTDKDGNEVKEIALKYKAGDEIVPPIATRNDGEYNYTWVPSLPLNNIMPAKDMTFVAQWEEVIPGSIEYTITPMIQILNADGTTSYIEGTVLTKTGNEGQTVEITVDGNSDSDITWIYSGLIKGNTNINTNIPVPNHSDNVLAITLTKDGDNALVAYFELAKRNIELDANGGNLADGIVAKQELPHGTVITLPTEDELTKNGYDLVGWEDSKGNPYEPGEKVSVTGDEKYEAVWEEKTYTLTFEEDGGTPDPTDPVLAAGALYNVPAVRKDGYRFNGWKAENGDIYAAGEAFTMPAENATLTAQWTRVYTVSYTDGEGNELKTGVAAEGEDIPVYTGTLPELEGHRFGGWENMPEDGKMPAGDLVLEPIFNKEYTLSYKYDVEDSALPALPAAEKLIAGEETTVKALPELEGYRFYGWDNNGTTYNPWDTFTMPAEDTELVVTWEEVVEYNLTFNENEGSEVDDVVLEAGKEYRLPASTKEGWVLKGWNDGRDTYPAGEIYVMPDFDIELNAVWTREITTAEPTTAPTYYISFVYDGGAPEGADVLPTDYPVKGGETYILPGLSSVDGIEFDYWYDSNNVRYPANFEYTVKGDMTFVAKWTEKTTAPAPTEPESTEPTTLAKYILSFDYEDGVKPDGAPDLPRDIIVEDGKTHELPALPKLDGYEFDGWYDKNGVRYPAGYNYPVTDNVTLFAKWAEVVTEPTTTEPTTTEAPKYELSFKHEATTPSNAPELPETEELKAGQVYVLPELDDIEGYEFKGWKDEKGAAYDAGYAFRMPAEATVLYADYEEIVTEPTKYTLSFNENEGSAVEDMQLLPGAIINLPKSDRENYEFIGWDDGEKVYAAGEAYEMPEGNTTLKAVWEEIPVKTYNVSYAYIGDYTPANADDVPEAKVITENDMVVVEALPSAVEGYEFFGWFYNGIKFKPGDTFAPASDPIVFEGFWVKNEDKFIVSYEYEGDVPANADELPEFATYNDGTTVTVASKPADVEGYTFEGWYLDSDRTAEVAEVTIDGENVAIVGVWSINKYDVVLDANGGTFSENDSEQYIAEDVEFGTDIEDILPEIPKKEGHTFIEWEGMPEDGTVPAGDVELTAKWEINEYTITFDSNGGTEVPSATYEYGAEVTEPAAPTRDKFIFVGWEPSLPDTMPANDVKVKAIWKAEPGVETHKLTADANGGEFADGTDEYLKELAAGEEIGELPVPSKDGYEFKGWEGMPEDGKMPEGDLTLKAIWEEVEPEVKKHTVNYYLVKGEGAEAEPYTSKTFEEGETMTHPAVTVEGFTFKGWTDAEGNPLPETMGTEDIDAYAQLEINEYKVTYLLDSTGAVYEEYANVKFASEVPVPADPTKEGYVFAGWEPAVVSTMPAHDLTYTAKWVTAPVVGDEFTARYVVDGKTYALYVLEEGDVIPVPAAPTKFGFVFVGWEPEVPDTMPAENVEFTAQWEVDKTFVGLVIGGTVVSGAIVGAVIGMNAALITGAAIVGGIIVIVGAVTLAKHTHTVTYIVDGEVYKVYKVVEGTKIPVPADPAKDGAEFAGWNPEVPEKMGNTDLVFEATWEDVGADVDVVIPDTGSFAGVAAFAVISGAAAAAYVITRKKKED